MRIGLIGTTGLALVLALPALAQERSLNFSLRGGVGAAPEYPGSDEYDLVPDIGVTFGALRWGNFSAGNGVRGIPDNGVALRGAFRFLGSRDADDAPELAGLEEIDTAVELGFGVSFQQTNWRAFGEVRKGVTGHSSVTGTLGADVIFRDPDRWVVTAGPRVNFGDSDYAQTYFGVSPEEAGRSSFDAFDADGGAIGAGIEVQGSYFLSDRWSLDGAVSYERLIGDAGDSPIAATDDQWRVRIGLSRAFNLNF